MAASAFSKIQSTTDINQIILDRSLTHLFLIRPFFTPWKHQKTLRFSDVSRDRERVHYEQVRKRIKNINQLKYKARQTQQHITQKDFLLKEQEPNTRQTFSAALFYEEAQVKQIYSVEEEAKS